jgi:DeoR family transcriptional regulator, catabolite repression regulator
MIKNNLGVICIINKNLILKGIFTDGDIRRKLIKIQKPLSAFFSDDVKNHMNKKPFTINKNTTVIQAIKLMSKRKIWDIPVVSKNNKLIGILHLNSLLKYLYKN